LSLSSRYFLKRSKIDISDNVKFLFVCLERQSDPDRAFRSELLSATDNTRAIPFRLTMLGRDRET
jgi:hypothetical protein